MHDGTFRPLGTFHMCRGVVALILISRHKERDSGGEEGETERDIIYINIPCSNITHNDMQKKLNAVYDTRIEPLFFSEFSKFLKSLKLQIISILVGKLIFSQVFRALLR